MNQFATGDFGHAVLYEDFTPEMVAVRAWWCCTLHGLRAFADVRDSVFRRDAHGVSYLLPIDGRFAGAEGELAATFWLPMARLTFRSNVAAVSIFACAVLIGQRR